MTHPLLYEYALNTLWQVPVLALATWCALRLTRPGPRTQHLLWVATLITAVLLPARGLAPEPRNHIPAQNISISSQATLWFLRLYGLTLAFNLVRLLHSYRAVQALVADAHNPTEQDLAHLVATGITLPRTRILSSLTASPMVAGVLHPTLLLPRHVLTSEHLPAILVHELTHIRRRDYLANLAYRTLSVPIAYHPATTFIHRRIRQTRELLCDAISAHTLGSSTSYARSLLTLATQSTPQANSTQVGLFNQHPWYQKPTGGTHHEARRAHHASHPHRPHPYRSRGRHPRHRGHRHRGRTAPEARTSPGHHPRLQIRRRRSPLDSLAGTRSRGHLPRPELPLLRRRPLDPRHFPHVPGRTQATAGATIA